MEFLNCLPEKERKKIADMIKPCVKLSFQAVDKLPVTASRLGGYGYLPKSMPYPHTRDGRKPLSLLAQINFAEMPAPEDFPKKGLLSFYISGGDDDFSDLWGLDHENPTYDNGFRVLYFPDHQEEGYSEADQAAIFEKAGYGELFLPVHSNSKKPIQMTGRLDQSHPLTCCREAADLFGSDLYDYFVDLLGADSRAYESISEVIASSQSHLISGYPYFTQEDPRLYGDPRGEFDTLLLQLDTDGGNDNDWGLMWGDAGVGNFFINRQRLKNLDFSRVLYNWDCF